MAECRDSTRPRSTTSTPCVFAATGTSHFTTPLDTPWPTAAHIRGGAAHACEANTQAGDSPSETDVDTSSDAPREIIPGALFGTTNAKLPDTAAWDGSGATKDGCRRYVNGDDAPTRIFGAPTWTTPGLCAGAIHSMPTSVSIPSTGHVVPKRQDIQCAVHASVGRVVVKPVCSEISAPPSDELHACPTMSTSPRGTPSSHALNEKGAIGKVWSLPISVSASEA